MEPCHNLTSAKLVSVRSAEFIFVELNTSSQTATQRSSFNPFPLTMKRIIIRFDAHWTTQATIWILIYIFLYGIYPIRNQPLPLYPQEF